MSAKSRAAFGLRLLILVSLPLSMTTVGCTQRDAHGPAPVIGAPAEGAPAVGARIYAGSCVPCHQEDARGIAQVYPSLVGSPVLLGDPRELARWVIRGERPRSLPTGRYSTMMLQFGWMKPRDAAALFTYLRTHYGNTGSAVDEATIAAALEP